MSMTQSIITYGFLPTSLQIIHPQTRISLKFSNSANVRNPGLFLDNARRSSVHQNGTCKRRFRVCNVVEPAGASTPSESAFNFLHWMGIATMVLPFFTHKWASLLKIKNEVDTAVNIAEGIVEAVEKVADEVEKVAEDIADDLPDGGTLRKAVDFVEHIAERASHDAHLVDTFIDKVQELEEKAEEYFESWGGPGASPDQPSENDKALESHTTEKKV